MVRPSHVDSFQRHGCDIRWMMGWNGVPFSNQHQSGGLTVILLSKLPYFLLVTDDPSRSNSSFRIYLVPDDDNDNDENDDENNNNNSTHNSTNTNNNNQKKKNKGISDCNGVVVVVVVGGVVLRGNTDSRLFLLANSDRPTKNPTTFHDTSLPPPTPPSQSLC